MHKWYFCFAVFLLWGYQWFRIDLNHSLPVSWIIFALLVLETVWACICLGARLASPQHAQGGVWGSHLPVSMGRWVIRQETPHSNLIMIRVITWKVGAPGDIWQSSQLSDCLATPAWLRGYIRARWSSQLWHWEIRLALGQSLFWREDLRGMNGRRRGGCLSKQASKAVATCLLRSVQGFDIWPWPTSTDNRVCHWRFKILHAFSEVGLG